MHDAAPGARSFRLAPQLIPIPFDVIQSISNDHIIFRNGSLDRRKLFSASGLLSCGAGINLIAEAVKIRPGDV